MKKILLLFVLTIVSFGKVDAQTKIPKNINDEFGYTIIMSYRQGQNVAVLINDGLRKAGYNMMDMGEIVESIMYNTKNRDIILKIFHDYLGSDSEYLYMNLSSLGISATSSKYLTNYIVGEKYKSEKVLREEAIQREKELEAKRIAEMKRKEEKALEEKKRLEITSKVYDLSQFAPDKYQSAFNNQKDEIINYFMINSSDYYSTNNFPSFQNLEKSNLKFERFNNTYTISYEIDKLGNSSSNNTKTIQQVELIGGTDQNCTLLKSTPIQLPIIQIEGYNVKTKATFNNVKVDFTRGITKVKIKKGEVLFTKFLPEQDLQSIIIENLKNMSNGKYIVKYEIGNILGQEIINVQVQ